MRGRKPIDLSGQRFGRWTVIEREKSRIYEYDGYTSMIPIYRCRCDCGFEGLVLAHNLKSGMSKSCGCLRDDLAKERAARRKNDG